MFDTIRKYCEFRYMNRRPDKSAECANYNTYTKYASNKDYSMYDFYPSEYTDSYYVASS